MDDPPRSRHIPREVALRLLEAQRFRCCVRSPVCGEVLLDPNHYDPEALAESLDRHHIVQFSAGGEHTYENLLLACANCHDQIHRHPDDYPPEELLEKKVHWVGMKDVVPAELRLPREAGRTLQVTFSVESANLQYAIAAPADCTVAELARFVRDTVLRPLGEYDYQDTWVGVEQVELALRSAPERTLDPQLCLEEVGLAPGDALVAHITRKVIPTLVPLPEPVGGEGPAVGRDGRPAEAQPGAGQRAFERRHPFEPEMVFVPAGPFWMGTDRRALEAAGIRWESRMEHETPYHRVTLPDYWIGRYPVTHAEYRRFIEGGGYRTRAYWTEAGWRWKEQARRTRPWYWDDERYNAPQQPVVGVTWYEAVAYCRWLAQVTGRPYRLPGEAEWEKAARGADGRIWPWGNRWDPERCNTWEKGPRRTTPVGRYSPAGDSPYGCADMAGNVWEWCATRWEDNYENYRGDDDLEGDALRVLRGGSFLGVASGARCAVRGPDHPRPGWGVVGLRVVCGASSIPLRSGF